MTVNAFIHATFVCGLAFCLWDFLGRKNGWFVCFSAGAIFRIALCRGKRHLGDQYRVFPGRLLIATLVGLGFARPGSRWWWLGLAVAILGLFTMASGLLAPMAVGGLMVLRIIKKRRMERENLITLGVCLMVVGLGAALNDTSGGDRSLRAHSLMEFASALARNLTWPFFRQAGMACLFLLPLVALVALYFRPNFQSRGRRNCF